MLVDIHTHNYNLDNQSIIKVVCLDVFNRDKAKNELNPDHLFFSAGVHPWDVGNYNQDTTESLRLLLKDERVIAIGECGLDMTHKETIDKQKVTFNEMINISENTKKPMIIHSVRAYSDIISVKKKSKAKMPWIIHGFNGSLQTAQQLIGHGMYISLGEILYRNVNQAVKLLHTISPDKIFLETDVAERSIIDVYNTAASLVGCDIECLEKLVFENFKRVFFDGKLEEQNAYSRW